MLWGETAVNFVLIFQEDPEEKQLLIVSLFYRTQSTAVTLNICLNDSEQRYSRHISSYCAMSRKETKKSETELTASVQKKDPKHT